jgi:hypothetical protein
VSIKSAAALSKRKAMFAVALLAPTFLGSCGMPTGTDCLGPPRELATATNQAFAPVLAAAVNHSRTSAQSNDLRAIPDPIRDALSQHYPAKELAHVRWIIADEAGGLARFLVAENTRYKAVTLGNLIVFENESAAQDLGLWAHELIHVQHYQQAGGTLHFAREYLADWPSIEREAVSQTNLILDDLSLAAMQNAPTAHRCISD